MVDALSKKTQMIDTIMSIWTFTAHFTNWHPWLVGSCIICNAIMDVDLANRVWAAKRDDDKYGQYARKATYENSPFSINELGQIRFKDRTWLPNHDELKNEIHVGLHNS